MKKLQRGPNFTCPHCGYDQADEATWKAMCDGLRRYAFAGPPLGDLGDHYILNESHQPVGVCLLRWAQYLESKENRRVAETNTKLFWISTVFLGLNCNWGSGPPILFETMVFTRDEHMNPTLKHMVKDDLEQVRYSSWDDAVAGHEAMVRRYQKREADAIDLWASEAAREFLEKTFEDEEMIDRLKDVD